MQDTQILFRKIKHIANHVSELLKDSSSQYLESTNSSGDTQLAVDVAADVFIENELLELDCVYGICSEEKEHILSRDGILKTDDLLTDTPKLQYAEKLFIAYDPLDGSSLMDSNLAVGGIFGIYKGSLSARNLIGASYIVYGPRVEIVFVTKEDFFYQKRDSKQNYLDLQAPKLSQKGKLNSPGGTQKYWSKTHKDFIDSLFSQGYRLRYSGGMVPDLHQILIKGGGIFSYPAAGDAPNGKLRRLFEVFPMSFIYERAGGLASNGKIRTLELGCDSLHQTTPCFLGSAQEIIALQKAYENGGEK